MDTDRRGVLKAGGAVALCIIGAGCQSVFPGSSRPLAYLEVTNKSPSPKTITLTASVGDMTPRKTHEADESLSNWVHEFTLAEGKTKDPNDNEVLGRNKYTIELRTENGPADSWEWANALGTMNIEVYEDRIKHWTDEDA